MNNYKLLPFTIIWYITNLCNLHCDFCYASYEREYPQNLEKICQDIINMHPFSVGLIGGEPFMHPELFNIVEKFEESKIKVNIATNGTLLDSRYIEKLLSFSNINNIQISLDGSNKHINDSIRGIGTYEKIIEAINLCVANNLKVIISTVISKLNLHDIINIIQLLEKLSVREVLLANFLPSGNGVKVDSKYAINSKQANFIFNKIAKYEKENNLNIKIHKPHYAKPHIEVLKDDNKKGSKEIYHYSCLAGTRKLAILPNGDIVGCELMPKDAYGNINKETMRNIWTKEKNFEKWRNIKQVIECMDCSIYNECRGGCRASSLLIRNSFYAKDPLCY